MTGPILTASALAPLRRTVEAGLTDTVTLHKAQEADAGHGGETIPLPPKDTGPFGGNLIPLSAEEQNQAAARGITATYRLKLPLGTAVRPGLTATVEGTDDDGNDVSREVLITSVPARARLALICTAVDVALNQSSPSDT